MAKSLLKTKIVELLGVRRNTITFESDESSGGIFISSKALLKLDYEENGFCCGILDCGDLELNSSILSKLDAEHIADLIVDCMGQFYKMAKAERQSDKGIMTFSHTSENPVVLALLSECNTEDKPWKLISEFHNPNTGNTVNYFMAEL